MEIFQTGGKADRRFVLALGTGEEVTAQLVAFARDHVVNACRLSAIGAVSDAVLGYFDWELKTYLKIPIREQVEVVSLVGSITHENERPKVHAHMMVSRRDGSALGGHLLEAHVRPTLEVFLTELPVRIGRVRDQKSGLFLLEGGRLEHISKPPASTRLCERISGEEAQASADDEGRNQRSQPQ